MSAKIKYLLTANESTGALEKVERLGDAGEIYEVDLAEFIGGLSSQMVSAPTSPQVSISIHVSGMDAQQVQVNKAIPNGPNVVQPQPMITCPLPRVLPNPPRVQPTKPPPAVA
jgi:hypothetical protein